MLKGGPDPQGIFRLSLRLGMIHLAMEIPVDRCVSPAVIVANADNGDLSDKSGAG